MRLPVLHLLVPCAPCALLVNGTLCGTSMDSPVLPVSPNGTVFITCLPLSHPGDAMYLPHTVGLPLHQGLPNGPIYGCKLYIHASGAMDVELLPVLYHQEKAEELPYTVSRATFTHSGHSHSATLYFDNGWRVAIEETGKDLLLLCQPISDLSEGRVQAVSCFTSSDILVSGRGSRGPRSLMFSHIGGQYALVADEEATCTIDGHLATFTQPLRDVAGHEKRYALRLLNEEVIRDEPAFGHFSKRVEPLASPALVCAALCEAVALSLLDEALSYMTQDLKTGMALEDLAGFFGKFDKVYEVHGEGPYTVYLSYPLAENVYHIQSFRFEMNGMLVANIESEE